MNDLCKLSLNEIKINPGCTSATLGLIGSHDQLWYDIATRDT